MADKPYETADFKSLLLNAIRYFRMGKPCFIFQLFVWSRSHECTPLASHTPTVKDDFVVMLTATQLDWRSSVAGIWPELRMSSRRSRVIIVLCVKFSSILHGGGRILFVHCLSHLSETKSVVVLHWLRSGYVPGKSIEGPKQKKESAS